MTPVIVPFGRIGMTFTIDLVDYERVTRHKWSLRRKPDRVYVYTLIAKKKVPLHRLIMNVTDPDVLVDHANGDGLDNRRCNLRVCTHKQNSQNQLKPRSNTSGFKGVRRARNKWRAVIQHEGRKYDLGTYTTPTDAHAAYMLAARAFFGEFAHSGERP